MKIIAVKYTLLYTGIFCLPIDLDQNSSTAILSIIAKVGFIQYQLHEFDGNACNEHLNCPLNAGQSYTLNYTLTVPRSVPTVSLVKIIAKSL